MTHSELISVSSHPMPNSKLPVITISVFTCSNLHRKPHQSTQKTSQRNNIMLFHLLLTLTIFLILVASSTLALTDKDILLQSKAQLIGSCTECLPTWNVNNRLEDFEGVNTTTPGTSSSSSASPRVLKISLHYRSLRGTFPPSWSLLNRTLSYVDLSTNALTGPLPEEWSALVMMTYLDLSYTTATGSLPDAWSVLVKMTHFDVSGNSLDGTLPSSYSAWTSLEHFDVAFNKISGFLPLSFQEWKMMNYFSVPFNDLCGKLRPEYSAWENVTEFHVGGNNFIGALPKSFSLWKKIHRFTCYSNQLSGKLPDSYQSWGASLWFFLISGNRFSGSLPPSWSSWMYVYDFSASSTGLSGTLPESYKNWSGIAIFDVSLNQLTGELPSVYKSWSSHIAEFFVNSNQLTGTLPPEYSAWSGISDFRVSSNQFTGEFPSSYSNWYRRLYSFQANNNFFNGSIPSSYASLTQLSTFDVSNNQLSGPISSSFGIAWRHSLQTFSISENKFSGQLPVSFSNLTQLTQLDVSNNLLEGTISSDFCSLDTLVAADFSQNCVELSSEVIECFSQFKALAKLRYAPSCFSVPPVLTNAPLDTSYSYNVANKQSTTASDCQQYVHDELLSECFDVVLPHVRFTNTVDGDDTIFQFTMLCGASVSRAGHSFSVPFRTTCYAVLFRPLLQCFLDEEATIPCSTNPVINYPTPSYHNETVLADVSPDNNKWTLDASNTKYIYGVYFRIFSLASLNFAFRFTKHDGTPGPVYMRSNTTTPVFQASPCQLQTSVAIPFSTDCTVCPDLALCDGTTSIYVSTKQAAWRYSSDLLPFYECDLKTTKGCLKSINNNKFDGSSCKTHFTGFLCARCESDYAMVDGECSQCPPKGSIIGIFCACIVALLIIATLLVYISLDSVKKEKLEEETHDEEEECCDCSALEQKLQQYRPQLEKLTIIVRMLINHFTLLGALASTSAANQATDSLKTLLKIQNGGGGGALLGAYSGTLSCLFSNDNQTSSSVLNFNILWVVFASVFVFESIFFFAFTRKLTSTAAVALFLSFVAFSPLAEYSSKLLALCKPFDFYNTREYLRYGTNANLNQTFSYLSTDLAQECDDHFQNSARVGAALTISLFCGLLPVIIAFAYKKIQSAEDRAAIFSFMTEDYKKEAWYYELIVMVRKLLIALAISIFVEQGDLQLQLFTLVTTMMLGASLTIQPLQSKIANIVDQVSISSALVCATFLSVISGFADDEGVAIASTVLIFITQVVAILAIVLFSHRSEEGKNSSSPNYLKEQEVGNLNAPLLFSAKDSELATEQDDDDERHLSYWKRRAEESEKEKMELKKEKRQMENTHVQLEADFKHQMTQQKELENENRLLREKVSELEKNKDDKNED